jgi:phage terminase large subunit-like protein
MRIPDSDLPVEDRRFGFTRVAVSVDPSGGKKARNDEQGITVGGLGSDGHGYVLADLSGKYTPEEWARKAINAYHEYLADCIVVERNFGGDMVKSIIMSIDSTVKVKEVVASRGKEVRAEPVASLYERGLVHHVGRHTKLEDEMTTWDPVKSTFSPNRLDSLVWLMTELMLGAKDVVYARRVRI